MTNQPVPMRMAHTDESYREAIDYLMDNPQEVFNAWSDPKITGGSLFAFCSPDGHSKPGCGCLTQVHGCATNSRCVVGFPSSDELTDAIVADDRIPSLGDDFAPELDGWTPVKRETLEAFAEWQERFDVLAQAVAS